MNTVTAPGAALLLALMALHPAPAPGQTLGDLLSPYGVPSGPGGLPELERPITSYAVEDAPDGELALAQKARSAEDT